MVEPVERGSVFMMHINPNKYHDIEFKSEYRKIINLVVFRVFQHHTYKRHNEFMNLGKGHFRIK